MAAKFKKPTIEEVDAYCEERGNGIDAAAFWDFYESKGWFVGRNAMKDWKAAVRTWERRDGFRPRDSDPFGGPPNVSRKTATTLRARDELLRRMEGER